MQFHLDATTGKLVGRVLSAAIIAVALILGLAVLYHSNRYPRTDDSEILANFIGIAPQVEGHYPFECTRQPVRQTGDTAV